MQRGFFIVGGGGWYFSLVLLPNQCKPLTPQSLQAAWFCLHFVWLVFGWLVGFTFSRIQFFCCHIIQKQAGKKM